MALDVCRVLPYSMHSMIMVPLPLPSWGLVLFGLIHALFVVTLIFVTERDAYTWQQASLGEEEPGENR